MSVVEFNKYHQAKTRAEEPTTELMGYLERNISPYVFLPPNTKGDTQEEKVEEVLYESEKSVLK